MENQNELRVLNVSQSRERERERKIMIGEMWWMFVVWASNWAAEHWIQEITEQLGRYKNQQTVKREHA